MKTFVLAIVSLVICIVFTFACSTCITSTAKRIEYTISDLPEVFTNDKNTRERVLSCVDEALYIWKDSKSMTLLGLSHAEYDEVEDLLTEIRASVLSGDLSFAARRTATLKEKLSKLQWGALLLIIISLILLNM